jgi:iron complex transport system permease protein
MSSLVSRRRVRAVVLCAGLGIILAALLGLAIGPTPISAAEILKNIAVHTGLVSGHLDPVTNTILWQIRAPRLVLGLLAGSMLAVAGGTYQGIFRNPLADPYILGVASGAGLGATLAIVGFGGLVGANVNLVPLFAFLGALVAVSATWLIGGRGPRSSGATLILTGVAVATLMTSTQTLLQQRASLTSLAHVYIWLLGSLASANWSTVLALIPYIGVCITACLSVARKLDVMSVGEVEARTLGLNVRQLRLVSLAAASLGTASVVSAVGLIGFVGLVVPHVVRMVAGTSYRRILPISALVGAVFLVFADTLARTVLAPSELPIGVITALVGAPTFVAILARREVNL